MTLDMLIDLLAAHAAALRSSAWPEPHGPANGPAVYLDAADTDATIAELKRVRHALAAAGETFDPSRVDRPVERIDPAATPS